MAASQAPSDAALLQGWSRSSFTAAGLTRDVFRRGSGPGVVVVHELPGITPAVLTFAEDVVAAGFTVALPSLVGVPGKDVGVAYTASSFAKVCVSREFSTWALNQTSPVISFLRATARQLHNEIGGIGVGAVGMCFSGGFALAMMVDQIVVAPVVSQPSLPFAVGPRRSGDLNLTPDDRLAVAQRAIDGCQVLGLQYEGDRMVGTRFQTLRRLLGDQFLAVDLPKRGRLDHSVLAQHRDEAGVERVLQFLRDKLQPPAQ